MSTVTDPVHDAYGRPVNKATFQGTFGDFSQSCLINIGVTLLLLRTKETPRLKDLPVRTWKVLERFNRKESMVPFTNPLIFSIRIVKAKSIFGLQALEGNGILGVNIILDFRLIVALPNQVLWQSSESVLELVIIPSAHQIAALKALEELDIPNWDTDVADIANRYPNV